MNSICLLRCNFVDRIVIRMYSKVNSYEEAVCKLNSLQSNKSTLEQIRRDIRSGQERCTNLEDMERYLARTGVSLSKLDELSVIHVAGTKGKGSTSAMCESILRQHGFRTGFYSSPHLVAVRERIRLDGRVVSEDKFSEYFHEVYDSLNSSKTYDGDMPKYFAFLTVLAYNMFLKEKVDVAIVEVGIGGIVDYTNVLRKVPVVGITALGIDHTSILGSTLTQIAAAKAGIMKRGCEAYTVAQPEDAMDVLRSVAETVQCSLTVVPDYKSYTFPDTQKSNLPINLEAYQTNASLAIQLAHAWMRINKLKLKQNGFKSHISKGQNGLIKGSNGYMNGIEQKKVLTEAPFETLEGIRQCKWPGRYQILPSEYAKFYLDGAHTKESMDICIQWFRNINGAQDKILIFSATGDRNAELLLQPLSSIDFKAVYFVNPTAYKVTSQKSDNFSMVEQEELVARNRKHADIWNGLTKNSKVTVLECVSEALVNIKKNYNTYEKPAVLITGSLHLVGATLSILDPNLTS